MIKKLKRKFIVLASVSMLMLMTVLLTIVNVINYSSVVAESDQTLDVLSRSSLPFFDGTEPPEKPNEAFEKNLPRGMSPEVPYESRYFTVTLDEDGVLLKTDVSQIVSVDAEAVSEYVTKAQNSKKVSGFVGQFRFRKTTDAGKTTFIFLDCGRKLDSFRNFLGTSFAVGFAGCVAVFLVFLFAAGRMISPISESYEKQKRFITDAGHEIKTPLTIIAANVDLLEADLGENEGFDDIRTQTKRLSKLTNDLVYLSKMEESEARLPKIEFPFSDLVTETAASFSAVATAGKKILEISVAPNLTANGAPEALRQLISILLENAMKYSPEGGTVRVGLTLQKKTLLLSVSNTLAEPMDGAKCSRLFDRFYRADASRNSETGGHGIGLSIAKAITEAHGGKITASSFGTEFKISVFLPQ